MFRRASLFSTVAICVAATVVIADIIQVPHEFVNGTTADAVEVNENFDTLVNESNAQDARIGAIEGALRVDAVGYNGGAFDGGTSTVPSVACIVNDADGPITGLTLGDFIVNSYLIPPGSSGTTVVQFNGNARGTYRFRLEPGVTWRSGTYVFEVIVTIGGKSAGTVCTMVVP